MIPTACDSSEKEAAFGLPQLGLRFLADSNSWNVNEMANLRTVRQMLQNVSQLASNNVLSQCSIFFQFG